MTSARRATPVVDGGDRRQRRAGTGRALAFVAAVAACQTTSPEPKSTPDAPPPTTAPTTKTTAPRPGLPDRAPSAEAYRAVLDAELAYLSGETRTAVELLREATLYDPDSTYLKRRLAELALETGDAERARSAAHDVVMRDPSDTAAAVVLARAHRLEGARDAARRVLEDALARTPGDRDASTLLAEVLLEDGKLKEAAAVLEDLMAREPHAIDGYLTLADLFASRGDLPGALRAVDQALERDPRAVPALEQKLRLLDAVGRYPESLGVVEALVREVGDSRGVRHALLVAHLLAGRTSAADELVRAWLEEDDGEQMRGLVADARETCGDREGAVRALLGDGDAPLSPRLLVEAGRLRYDAGDFAGASELACRAEIPRGGDAEYTGFVDALCARALLRADRVDEARARIERARVEEPHRWRTLEVWAQLSRRAASGVSSSDALQALARARTARPDDLDLVDLHARTLVRARRVDEARAIVDEVARARPDDPEARMLLARFLELIGDPRAGAQVVGDLLDRTAHPTMSQLNFLAFTLADHDLDPELAVRTAWRAVVMSPQNGFVLDTLGWAQLRHGDVSAAHETLTRAARLSPDEPEILSHLAEAARRRGDAASARAHLARARAVADPDDERLLRLLDGLAARLGIAR